MSRSLVEFWRQCVGPDRNGRWVHPSDSEQFERNLNSFNTDYPPSPYIGNVIDAPIIILGLNGRFSSGTAVEFSAPGANAAHLTRISHPESADWRAMAAYYIRETNFGGFILNGQAVVVNGCTYRSPKWSSERENQRFARKLPSSAFLRQWLEKELVPATARGDRLVIAWRWNSWLLTAGQFESSHFRYSSAPVSSSLTANMIGVMQDHLRRRRGR